MTDPPQLDVQSRNLEIIQIRVGDLLDHEANWQEHPDKQQQALTDTVDQIGWYGFPDVIRVELDGQTRYKLINGHLRKSMLIEKYGEDTVVEVNLTDLDEKEAEVALLTIDPVSKLAGMDRERLGSVVSQVADTNREQLDKLLAKMRNRSVGGLIDEQQVEDAQNSTGDSDAPWAAGGGGSGDGSGSEPSQPLVTTEMLLYTEAEHTELTQRLEQLQDAYGTSDQTETILELLVRSANLGG